MPSFKQAFPRKYLGAPDVEGDEALVTIVRVGVDPIQGDAVTENKLVAEIAEPIRDGGPTKWILNRTNANSIADLAGTEDYLKWSGVSVTLYKTHDSFRGKQHEVIRVRPAPPATQKPAINAANTLLDGDNIQF